MQIEHVFFVLIVTCFVNSGDKADLFTGVFFNHYNPPDGFCFDIWCNDDPIQVMLYFTLQCIAI